jgi:predicted ATPase
VNARATPSLRIARLVVENFRTFREPTEIPLGDEVAVFHGENGSGKSNALAALELFFRASIYWLKRRAGAISDEVGCDWGKRDDYSGLSLSSREWPPGTRAPMRITVHFANGPGPLTVNITHVGNWYQVRLEGLPKPSEEQRPTLDPDDQQYLTSVLGPLTAPFGQGSKSFFRLDARRRDYRFVGEGDPPSAAPSSPLSPELALRLLDLKSSYDPIDIERWRAFTDLVSRFKTLHDYEVDVLRMPDNSAELRFEIRRQQVLRTSELSSGEQQAIALCAAVLTSRAAIVAIEEPEISLSPAYQELVRDMLKEQVQRGLVDQIILESHVPVFDGPEVIRFSRSAEGVTSVVRQASDANDELHAKAREGGAKDQWVTPEGYTKLPPAMVDALGLRGGGRLWFARIQPAGRWAAWTTDEVTKALGLGKDEPEE